MTQDYAREKFFSAVLGLAQGDRPARERLADAYTSSLMHLRPDDLPKELQKNFKGIESALTRVSAKGDEGSVAASAAALDDREIRQIIEKVVSMADALAKYAAGAVGGR